MDFSATTPEIISGMWQMLGAFLINTVFVWLIIHFLYFKKSRRHDFYFTFVLISVAIFFLMFFMVYMLDSLKGKTSIGIGIGLFGIFSIMRYRTDAMPVREMTYLFCIICLSVVNALSAGSPEMSWTVFVPNVIMLVSIAACETFILRSKKASKLIQYDRIALVKPERRQELLDDLRDRTGLDIDEVKVGSIDFLRDMAILKVYYNSKDDGDNINDTVKLRRDEWENVENS